jgi:hypothetical protein
MMGMNKEYIFALIDPRTEAPFYVGRTVPDGQDNWVQVDLEPSAEVSARIAKKLLQICADGMPHRLVILEETTDGERMQKEWIQHWISEGCDLVNDPVPEPQLKSLTLRLPEPEYQKLREFAHKNDKTYQKIMRDAVLKSVQG